MMSAIDKLQQAIERLVGLGTQPQKDPRQNQIIRLINKICLFVILVITPHMLLTLYFRSLFATLVQLVAILALGLTVYLNSRHYFHLVRALTLLIGNIHIFNMVIILGLDCGVYFYFSAALIAPLFFYTKKEIAPILFFATLSTILTLLVQYLGTRIEPIVETPVALRSFFFYFSVFGSQVTVFAFVLYFYSESNRFEQSLKAANSKLLKLSETDPLTQLPNRRSFNTNLDREWGKGIRNKSPLSLIMMDVDHFKKYNDCYGHQEGDKCLSKIAELISKNTREYIDFPARYGGEEFIILLSNTNTNDACIAADRIRERILSLAIPHRLNEHGCVVTCSLGVACCVPDNEVNPEDLIRRADSALYSAKNYGRNRVVVSE
ncbi:MAG: diguanylate cyclase [Thermodesulfobacteriota bacterium]